jgi:hypothetical protein
MAGVWFLSGIRVQGAQLKTINPKLIVIIVAWLWGRAFFRCYLSAQGCAEGLKR